MAHLNSLNYVAQMNHLGHAVLIETLRSAAYYLTFSDCRESSIKDFKEYKSCYFFVQGTGLDIMLNEWNLDYEAQKIRQGFNYYVRH